MKKLNYGPTSKMGHYSSAQQTEQREPDFWSLDKTFKNSL